MKRSKIKDQKFKAERGQIVIILLLIMLVGLVLAITVTQRSVNDLSVSTQSEQATRAFSAAEAGIERALSDASPAPTYSLSADDTGNDSNASVKVTTGLPRNAAYMATQDPSHWWGQAIEEPVAINTNKIAQVWLADPRPAGPSLPAFYAQPNVKIYFGDPKISDPTKDPDMPAMEVYVIARDDVSKTYYRSRPYLYDPVNIIGSERNPPVTDNKFYHNIGVNIGNSSPQDTIYCNGIPGAGFVINTDLSPNGKDKTRPFRCAVRINFSEPGYFPVIPNFTPVLMRIRFIYTTTSHPIAVEPDCPVPGSPGCSLPYQTTVYTSTGKAGQSIKTVQVTKQDANYLPFFDFAIFSGSDITK